jgi:hypothetical protein
VRGSARFSLRPADLRNPAATVHLLAQSSGSRGPSTPVPMDLRSNWDQAVNRRLTLEARGALGWRLALWSVPGGMEAMIVLRFAASGKPPERWFSPLDPASSDLHARYRLSAVLLQVGARLAGVGLPGPVWAPLNDPRPLLTWLREVKRAGQTPHVKTIPGAALRLGRAAEAAGDDLAGVRLTLTGEPLTRQKRAILARLGADAVSDYGSVECGAISEWCAAPVEADEMHLFEDLHAVIQAGPDNVAGLPPRALLMTSLRPSAPLLFLNLSLGDQARLSRRECGCPLAAAGWRTLVHEVRSFEKLSVEGVSLLDADLVALLEEVLPARFGGSPADFQLVERTTDEGPSTLTLIVDPSVGPLDERALVEVFLTALGGGSESDRISALVLRQGRRIRVERRPPHAQASGKVLHLHQSVAARGRLDRAVERA